MIDPSGKRDRAGALWASAPVLLWLVAVAVAGPGGDFPLNDDWSYADTVRRLVEEGRFAPGGWTSMTLLAQALWGALFCLPGGFSHLALRLSTAVVGALGVLATYALAREGGAGRRAASLAAASLALHPLYVALGSTFMTDVPYTAACMGSAWAIARWLRTRTRGAWALAASLVVVATLVRQSALVVPIAAALAIALRARRDRAAWWAAFGWTAASALAFGGFVVAMRLGPGLPRFFGQVVLAADPWTASAADHLRALARLLPFALLLLATSAAPMALPAAAARLSTAPRPGARETVAAAGAALVLGASALGCTKIGQVLEDLGIGPTTLLGAGPGAPIVPVARGWLVLAAAIAIASGAAAALLAAGVRADAQRSVARWFVALLAAVHVAASGWTMAVADRHFLPVVALLLAALAAALPKVHWSRVASWVLLAPGAYWAVAGTHDYLAWNEARWALLAELETAGVPPTVIDGGFEYNASRLFRPDRLGAIGKSWWWVTDDVFVVAFAPRAGYEVLEARPFARWLPPGEGHVLLLRRAAAPARE